MEKRIAVILSVALCLLAGCVSVGEKTAKTAPETEPVKKVSTEPKAMPKKVEKVEKTETQEAKEKNPIVIIETTMGPIQAELFSEKTPATVKNFLKYADAKFFDGTIFHRVIAGFMIQGGGFGPDMKQKSTRGQLQNEARADLLNTRGTLAMARTMRVHSATAQFFINLKDNEFLNHRGKTPQGYGYCVFGKVTAGMDVVDRIAKAKTGNRGHFQDVPIETVTIKNIRLAK